MNKTFFSAIILLLFVIFINAQDKIETSNALLETLVSDGFAVGASGSYSINGKVIWEATAGYANRDKNQDFTLDTEVRTASIAKSMTAIAVMQLVEKDFINIDLPIDKYIPEFVQKHETKITTKHLLSHTSGISAYKNGKEADNKINYSSLLDAYEVFKDRKLSFEPGTEFYYTTYGYVVLGILIEKVSNMSYEDYMQKHIWDKIEMTNTGIEKSDVKREKATTLYHRDRKGKIKRAKEINLSNRTPSGGLYSTANDLIKFENALMINTLVSKETYELMVQQHSLEKINNGYGFGFYLYGGEEKEDGIIGHNGAQRGTSTQLFVIPSIKTVVIVVANTSGIITEVSTVAGKLFNTFRRQE
ncbi:serine hydrolase domain-containing protein [Winogradskyella sp. PG-2]|uniref:serine hydrolase domain-containing protein n=1 Tax=Winogradskyella sp. PG-2 TaxID=754409 RepID=UPI00045887B8|nr:serine hydrolase domain-containing protein [Winogradskyella sp. PG-2]BAO76718.1 beta-lactamase class C and other penicillin binding proteins [Winogradskyella sp. PG-2]